jgi:steroid delta-isomerase
MMHHDALLRFRRFYDELSPAWLDRLEELYAEGFAFEDPFHTIDGDFDALRTYLRRVLALASTRFIVDDVAVGEDGAYVRWRWEWRRRAKDPLRTVVGMTHLRFDEAGRITAHRDIFDAAGGVYETLPILGGVLRTIRRRI